MGASGPAPGPGNDTDTEDPTTSPDGDQWGGTDVTDVPPVVIHEEPPEPVESPEIAVVSPGAGSTDGGTLVVIEGNDLAGPCTGTGRRWRPLTTERDAVDRRRRRRAAAPRRPYRSIFATAIGGAIPRRSPTSPSRCRAGPTTRRGPAAWPAALQPCPLTITGSGFTATHDGPRRPRAGAA